MNKLKQIFLYTLIISMVGMLGGCQKFLDRKPLSASLEDLNQGGIEGQVFGLYGAFLDRNTAYHGFNSIPYFALNSFRGDDAMKGSSDGDGADWGIVYDNFQYQKDHWSASIYWDQNYNLINKANTVLYIADSLKLTDPASLTNIAEAKFFRALTYFQLVRVFGEVPLLTTRVNNPNDAKIAKSSVSAVYALIDADLNAGIQSLPDNWKNTSGNNRFPGRLTKYAAMGLEAKAKMYRKDYAGALTLLQQIINSGKFSLVNNYATVFKVAGENSSESLFEIQADLGPNGTPDNSYEYALEQGVRGSGEWDLGWGWNTPTSDLVASYEAGDARKDATILYAGKDDGYGKTVPAYPAVPRLFYNKKVYPEPSMQALTGSRQNKWINHILLRYSDILLLAAEAANEVGGANATLATNWLNAVRNRAGLGNTTANTQTLLRTAIKKERMVELAMEGERFFDLVRWGDAQTVLGASGYTPCHMYYPLPQSAVDFAGGKLVQNPCW